MKWVNKSNFVAPLGLLFGWSGDIYAKPPSKLWISPLLLSRSVLLNCHLANVKPIKSTYISGKQDLMVLLLMFSDLSKFPQLFSSRPDPRWFITATPNLFGTRDWFGGRQFFQGGGDGSSCNVSDGERRMRLCLLSCAQLLLCGLVPNGPPYWSAARGLGDPWFIITKNVYSSFPYSEIKY